MVGTGLFLTDDVFDASHMASVEAYLAQEASLPAPVASQNFFFTEQDVQNARINEGLPFTITPAYDFNGKPNFMDEHGNLIAGIYSGMENEVYHSLPATSSSQVKKYAKSPAHYKRAYIDTVNRKRLAKATERTFDAGTYGHELILEPEGFYDRYFRLLNAADHENSIHTTEALKDKCKELSLPTSGTKAVLIERIQAADPTVRIFEVEQTNHIIKNAGLKAVVKAKEVMEASSGRPSLIDSLKHKDVKPLLHKTPIDPIVWDDAHRACKTVRENEFANSIIQNGFAELSVIAQCPETGMMLKVRFDWLTKDGIPADVKTTRSANPLMASYQFGDLGYDLQAYMYTYVGRLAGIPCPVNVFPFVTVEYTDADICEVFELCDDDWEIAERNFHRHIKNLAHSLENNDWPGYTRRNGSTLLRLPKRGRV